jgi:hypothetical protein
LGRIPQHGTGRTSIEGPADEHRTRTTAICTRLAPWKGRILALPPPYRAWLTISNDPDNTVLKDWRELDAYIWQELKLPLGDALFVRSFNCNLPGQVNLHDHPEIAAAHFHDTLHAWGDYVHARTRGFDRSDAEAAMALLESHGLRPRVWVDHSTHTQNMLHNSTDGSTPRQIDGSGTVYTSFTYTLDLATQLGVRYVWDGGLSPILGQDVPLSAREWYAHKVSSPLKAWLLLAWHWLSKLGIVRGGQSLVTCDPGVNAQYFAHKFADGQTLYCFRRFGTWDDSDIDGLAELLAAERLAELVERQGTCIVYTHLGKRSAARRDAGDHIPAATRAALANLRRQYDHGVLMLSPVSGLLDYLLLRDAIRVSPDGDWIDFRPDGISFPQLSAANLAGRVFGLWIDDPGRAARLEVRVAGQRVPAAISQHEDRCYTVSFPVQA